MDHDTSDQRTAESSAAATPTRREFLQGSLAVAGSTIGTKNGLAAALAPGGRTKRPNIVFFLGEGQRADALSLAGNRILHTPHHDRIGREGVHFRNAFCTNALCGPARSAALTGQYSRSTGVLSNKGFDKPIPEDIPLFTDLLREAGYEIAITGKIHVPNGVEERNWDYYFGHNSPGNDYVNPVFKEGRNGNIGGNQTFQNVYPDDLTVDRALAWLDEDRGDKPFCLLIWFVAPHEPFFRARRHADLYNGVPIPKPATFDDDLKGYLGKPRSFAAGTNKIGTTSSHIAAASLEGVTKDYYAGLVACDENIGRVFRYLEQKNILDDTAILHTSDHGYFLGEFRLFDKRLIYEPSIRVPFQVRYPKRIPTGTIRDEQVLDIDIAPTLLDLAGVSIPKSFQGKSILPLAHKPDPNFRKEWLYEYFEYPNPENVAVHRGIRTEQYKFVHYYKDSPEAFELYDIKADPGETTNLYDNPAFQPVREHLRTRLAALGSQVPVRSGVVFGPQQDERRTGRTRENES